MTRPIFEPTTQRQVAANEWGVSQLQRRPASGGAEEVGDWIYVGVDVAWENSWGNISSRNTRYRLNAGDLYAEFEIHATGGAPGTVMFNAPEVTPDEPLDLAMTDGAGGFASITVDTNGDVYGN